MKVWILSKTNPTGWEDEFETDVIAVFASYEDVCADILKEFGELGVDDRQCSAYMTDFNYELGYVTWKFGCIELIAEEWAVRGGAK